MEKSNYERMRVRTTFEEVLCNLDDQVTVRRLLIELVPTTVKWEIVRKFNEHAEQVNKEIEAFRQEAESKMRRPFTRTSDLWERFGGTDRPASDETGMPTKAPGDGEAVQ